MNDFLAVLRWWIENMIAAVPAFGAYFLGRWMQRRDDRAAKPKRVNVERQELHVHYPQPSTTSTWTPPSSSWPDGTTIC